MKPMLVIITINSGAAQAWLQHHQGVREAYDWRYVTDDSHLLGYHGVEYIDLGSSQITPFALEHFKAFNREWNEDPEEPALV